MTAARLLTALEGYLKPLVTAAGGTVETAEHLEDCHDKLAIGPDRWRVILTAVRGDAIGGTKRMETLQLLAVVQASKGLQADRNADGGPLLEKLEDVRGWICGARFAAAVETGPPTHQHPEIACEGFKRRNWYRLVDPSYPTRQLAAEFTIDIAPDGYAAAVVPVP